VTTIKKAFIRYPSEVGWALTKDYSRLPSFAAQGNILEAINTALNMLQLHFVDRDLHRCGNSIVVVSAGSGVFEVDKGLAGITKQRMMDNGIGKLSSANQFHFLPTYSSTFFKGAICSAWDSLHYM
jgi:phage-related tail fiber protein